MFTDERKEVHSPVDNIKEINLSELLSALFRKAWLIVLCAVIAGAGVYIYTANFVTEMYKSRVSVYVNSSTQSNTLNISATELTTAQRLVHTYIEMVESESVLELVAQEVAANGVAGKKPTAEEIKTMISAAPLEETEIFEVVVSSDDPQLACDIANAIGKVAPGKIEEFAVGSSTKIIDWPKPATKPYAPSKSRNALIGVVAGVGVAVCAIILQVLLDVRVKSEEDLAKISSAPVLGLIPDLAMENQGQHSYSVYKYTVYKPDNSHSKDGGGGV